MIKQCRDIFEGVRYKSAIGAGTKIDKHVLPWTWSMISRRSNVKDPENSTISHSRKAKRNSTDMSLIASLHRSANIEMSEAMKCF